MERHYHELKEIVTRNTSSAMDGISGGFGTAMGGGFSRVPEAESNSQDEDTELREVSTFR